MDSIKKQLTQIIQKLIVNLTNCHRLLVKNKGTGNGEKERLEPAWQEYCELLLETEVKDFFLLQEEEEKVSAFVSQEYYSKALDKVTSIYYSMPNNGCAFELFELEINLN